MIISFLIASVTTALVSAVWLDDWRWMRTVPKVGTGSPETLTYLVKDGAVVRMLCLLARSAAIRVAALPVFGNVGKLRDPCA